MATRKRVDFYRLADSIGDGTGEKNAVGGIPGTYRLTCGPYERLLVQAMIVYLEDSRKMRTQNYGGMTDPLPIGITISQDMADGPPQLVTDPDNPIKSNGDWALFSGNTTPLVLEGHEGLIVRVSENALMRLDPGESIAITMPDDMTGLIKHYFAFQGFTRAANSQEIE